MKTEHGFTTSLEDVVFHSMITVNTQGAELGLTDQPTLALLTEGIKDKTAQCLTTVMCLKGFLSHGYSQLHLKSEMKKPRTREKTIACFVSHV